MPKIGIYLILHRPSGRAYIGQAGHITSRWASHRRQLNAGSHPSTSLQSLWFEHKESSFEFQVAVLAPPGLDALQRQRWLISEERRVWMQYQSTGLALNAIRPAIVATKKAKIAFSKERQQNLRTRNAEITNKIKKKLSELEALQQRLRPLTSARSVKTAEAKMLVESISKGTGFKALFYGGLSSERVTELHSRTAELNRLINTLEGEIQPIQTEIHRVSNDLTQLRQSYPKNMDRELRRILGPMRYRQPKIGPA